MKAPSPAFSLYPKDMLSDEHCAAMSNEEFGCYMRLLCHAWLEGSAPSDPIKLQRILRVRPQTFARIWPALAPCFTEQDGRLFQSRLERERSQQVERSVINAAKGRKGGRPSKSTKQESRGFDSVKPSESLPSPSPSPSPSPVTNVNGTSAAGAALVVVALNVDSPIGPERGVLEAEALTLVREIAAESGRDPTEVMAEATTHNGRRGSMNPAAMTYPRLLNTVLDLRKMRSGERQLSPLTEANLKALGMTRGTR